MKSAIRSATSWAASRPACGWAATSKPCCGTSPPASTSPEFRFFIIALSVQRETGGNLAETLANLGDVLRRRRQMRAKVRAMSSETRATTMILGGMPVLVIVMLTLTSPHYLAAALHRCPRPPSRRSGGRNARDRGRHHDQDGEVRNMRSTRLDHFQIADWLPPGVGVDDVIVLLASLAALAMFFAMWQALRPNSPFERRLEQIVKRKETLRQSALANRRSPHRRSPVGLMREAVTRLNLLRSRHAADARQMLARAGIRSQDAMVQLSLRADQPAVRFRHADRVGYPCAAPDAAAAEIRLPAGNRRRFCSAFTRRRFI